MKTTYLIDTNLLVYAYNEDSEYHEKSKNIIENALNGSIEAFVADKNLLEFVAIITDSKRVEKPVSITEASTIVNLVMNSFLKVLYSTSFTINKTMELANKYQISKQRIFDLILSSNDG